MNFNCSGAASVKALTCTVTFVLASAVGADAVAQSAEQFDLVCDFEGSAAYDNGESRSVRDAKFVILYTVDLTSGLFCSDCDAEVYEMGTPPTALDLDLSPPSQPDMELSVSVNRRTGRARYRAEVRGGMEVVTATGKCERAPFAGIPTAF